MKKLIELLKLDPKATEDQIAEAVAALQKENADLKAAQVQASEDEKVIREKMALGLTRDQAMAVITRQREHDKAEAEAKKKAEEAAKKK